MYWTPSFIYHQYSHPIYYYPTSYYRPYPRVNINQFTLSAKRTLGLLPDARLLLNRISNDRQFATTLMTEAEHSQPGKVNEIVSSLGMKHKPNIHYNPDGITLKFTDEIQGTECCHLILQLRWIE
ncbi:MAG TPA: hypothetical protein VEY51_09860 [Chondromyces sp.]|nr:hypothetical protein [Chondromyces sp.]